MRETQNYQKYSILFVDDDATMRKYFLRLFSEKFRIIQASDGLEATEIFQANADDIAIIVTDQRMPNETGISFLSKINVTHPDIIKILSTGYSDIDAAIGSVNQGGIFRYITKPWDVPQLEISLRRAMEFFVMKRERDALLSANIHAIAHALLASRLAAFALVPVCRGLKIERAAEAIASFIRIAVAGRTDGPATNCEVSALDWSLIHSQQLSVIAALEKHLPGALKKASSLDQAAEFLGIQLKAAGAGEVKVTPTLPLQIRMTDDPLPGLLNVLLGQPVDPTSCLATARVLAGVIVVYAASGVIQRLPDKKLHLEVSPTGPATTISPGHEAAKWLVADEHLLSSALGLV